ncbi:d-galacturonic acid reductase [Moniliophthora roreri]|nr:d-galacturonic acid reductase [Moniliophthora roreri]
MSHLIYAKMLVRLDPNMLSPASEASKRFWACWHKSMGTSRPYGKEDSWQELSEEKGPVAKSLPGCTVFPLLNLSRSTPPLLHPVLKPMEGCDSVHPSPFAVVEYDMMLGVHVLSRRPLFHPSMTSIQHIQLEHASKRTAL